MPKYAVKNSMVQILDARLPTTENQKHGNYDFFVVECSKE